MNPMRLMLDQQLHQLVAQRDQIEEYISEVHRRFGVLEDIESWELMPQEENMQGSDDVREYEYASSESN